MDYEIMSGNLVTAVWKDRQLDIKNKQHLPLFLMNFSDLDSWLQTRAIDGHRANSRLLKKALRLTQRDDINTVLSVHAATITDNYWIRPVGSMLCWEDVKFNHDYFSELALRGNYDSFNRAALSEDTKTPELTNIGSFEKCWKLEGKKWWLYKQATPEELFSEVYIYELGKGLGMRMAEYRAAKDVVKSLDFTNGGEIILEHANSFMGDEDDYEAVIGKLKEICPQAVTDYIRMIFLDTITANPDRHTANFGLLRSADSGELIGLAPLFDHNMALISRGYPKPDSIGKPDFLIKLFQDVLRKNPDYHAVLPVLSRNILKETADAAPPNPQKKFIAEYIWSRYQQICC